MLYYESPKKRKMWQLTNKGAHAVSALLRAVIARRKEEKRKRTA
jgi:hypothetical protein